MNYFIYFTSLIGLFNRTVRVTLVIFQNCLNNFELSLVVFLPNITKNHAITYTYTTT